MSISLDWTAKARVYRLISGFADEIPVARGPGKKMYHVGQLVERLVAIGVAHLVRCRQPRTGYRKALLQGSEGLLIPHPWTGPKLAR